MVPRLGWSHDTPASAKWDGNRLTIHKAPPHWLDLDGWQHDHGDGTVPAFSAVPLELGGHNTFGWRARDRHGPMAASSWVPDLVEAYERRAPLTAVQGEVRHASLGLDLDELHLAGLPVPVRVRVRGDVPGSGEPAAVWALLRQPDEPRARTAEVKLEWDPADRCYGADLPGQRPGLYDLKVTARAVPGAGDLTVTDTVAVVTQ
ncbi:hypothetical protein ACFQ0M_34625 [Kitasatospora aburaviensis]